MSEKELKEIDGETEAPVTGVASAANTASAASAASDADTASAASTADVANTASDANTDIADAPVADGAADAAGDETAAALDGAAVKGKREMGPRLMQFWQFVKFALFSASAGVIQLLTTTTLHQWTGWLKNYYYIAYVIGLTLSVIWNFTFNRKFTFKAANNVPLAMALVVIYNCIIVVPLALGGDALVRLWGDDWGILVTAISLLINFITEFFWDKFVVFNDKVTGRLEKFFRRKK